MQVHIIVHGQVQGVFFRHSAVNEAQKLGIVGWVRNNPEGSVEVWAEGDQKSLEKFIAWCKKGPQGATVVRVEIEWGDEVQNYQQFEIV